MFLAKLTAILVCVLAVEIFLVIIYVRFKIKAITKDLNDLKKHIFTSMAFLKTDNGRHETWMQTLSTKMDALEIIGKIKRVGDKNESIN